MKFFGPFNRLIAKVLFAAILLQTVAPAMAALQSKNGSPWTEICTASGSKWVTDSADAGDHFSGKKAAHDHCVFCNTTGAADQFDVHQFLPSQYSVKIQPRAVFSPVASYAGHSILSRAPPL
ncbi:MAG: DUF2946 family protein [Burkholderiaceae bacterium]|jgi:hypothetical protein